MSPSPKLHTKQSHLEQIDVLLYVDHTFASASLAYVLHRKLCQGKEGLGVNAVVGPAVVELEIDQ